MNRLLRIGFCFQSFLFILSLMAINAWGSTRGEIWTQPKLLAVSAIAAFNVIYLLFYIRSGLHFPRIDRHWRLQIGCWLAFLSIGLISTLNSPFPIRSLWGQATMGDGLVYWGLMAIFTLSNAGLLAIEPRFFRYQLYGLLAGGGLTALSIVPQLLDWRIDYTVTTGQISDFNPQMLESAIWQWQMPIGFYSNRGHVAFVLAATGILALLALFKYWLRPKPCLVICVMASMALLCTRNRAGVLAFSVAALYLLWQFWGRSKLSARSRRYLLLGLCTAVTCGAVGLTFFTPILERLQALIADGSLERFSTGRLYLWSLCTKGFLARPLFGWGFNGFGISQLFTADWVGTHVKYLDRGVEIARVTGLNDFTFDYLGVDGADRIGMLITNKAHNFFLDTLISVGIFGLVVYTLAITAPCILARQTRLHGIEAIVLAYFVYTLTWYETAQFSHLAWWALSAVLAYSQDSTQNHG
ncbi:MAG: O-antigen ligase family protein [Cyanobacteria bacterium J06641_5]